LLQSLLYRLLHGLFLSRVFFVIILFVLFFDKKKV